MHLMRLLFVVLGTVQLSHQLPSGDDGPTVSPEGISPLDVYTDPDAGASIPIDDSARVILRNCHRGCSKGLEDCTKCGKDWQCLRECLPICAAACHQIRRGIVTGAWVRINTWFDSHRLDKFVEALMAVEGHTEGMAMPWNQPKVAPTPTGFPIVVPSSP